MPLILANVLAVILESVASLSSRYSLLFDGFELFSVLVFTVEYPLRLGSCTADSRFTPSLDDQTYSVNLRDITPVRAECQDCIPGHSDESRG